MQYRSEAQRRAVWANSGYGAPPASGPHWSRKVLPKGHNLRGRGGRATRRRAVLGGVALGGIGAAVAAAGAYGRFTPIVKSQLGVTGRLPIIDWHSLKTLSTFHTHRPATDDELGALKTLRNINKPMRNAIARRAGFRPLRMGRLGEDVIWHAPGTPTSIRILRPLQDAVARRIERASVYNIGGRGMLAEGVREASHGAQVAVRKLSRQYIGKPLGRHVGAQLARPFTWGGKMARQLDVAGTRFVRRAARDSAVRLQNGKVVFALARVL